MRAVDLFAGAGGSSTWATLAGLEVVAAVDHWPVAVASHRLNHPRAAHHCEDAATLDPTTLPAFDVLIASPSCTGHTPARGVDKPHHDAARATAWCVIRVAEACSPRLIVVASRGRVRTVALEPVPHVPARDVLDLEGGAWHPWREYAAKSVARIEAAQARRGSDLLVAYYGSESSHAGVSLDGPIGTLTTRDRYVLVRGERARVLTVAEQLALSSFPADYRLEGNRRDRVMQIGNAVPPLLMRRVLERAAG